MLEQLKRLCEQAIAAQLAPDNVSEAFDLAEQFNAPELSKRCGLFCLEKYEDMVAEPSSVAAYMETLKKMIPRLRAALEEEILRRVPADDDDGSDVMVM